jgi:hypothetical protein
MIESLILLLVVGLILFLIYFVVGKFAPGTPHQIIGIVLAIIFLLIALKQWGLLGGGPILRT